MYYSLIKMASVLVDTVNIWHGLWRVPPFIGKAFSVLGGDTFQASSGTECVLRQTSQRKPNTETLKLVGGEQDCAFGFGAGGLAMVVSFQPSDSSISFMLSLYFSLLQTLNLFSKIRQLWSAHLTFCPQLWSLQPLAGGGWATFWSNTRSS